MRFIGIVRLKRSRDKIGDTRSDEQTKCINTVYVGLRIGRSKQRVIILNRGSMFAF